MNIGIKLGNINSMDEIGDAKANKLVFIPIGKLVPNRNNSSELFVDDSLKESIKQIGLNVPLDVIELDDGRYEISSGERRYTAFLSLLKEDPEFRYLWKGNQTISPVEKGIPCTVNRRDMSEEDRDLVRLIGNKSRDYDPLELYNLFLTANNAYEGKKKKNEIAWGDGRKVEWLSDYLSISPRTIQKMIEDSWIINSKNNRDVRKAGSYSSYVEKKKDSEDKPAGVTDDNFNKEFAFLDRIQKHHSRMDFDKLNINEWQFDDLRKNAILTVQSIMEKYGLSKKDI